MYSSVWRSCRCRSRGVRSCFYSSLFTSSSSLWLAWKRRRGLSLLPFHCRRPESIHDHLSFSVSASCAGVCCGIPTHLGAPATHTHGHPPPGSRAKGSTDPPHQQRLISITAVELERSTADSNGEYGRLQPLIGLIRPQVTFKFRKNFHFYYKKLGSFAVTPKDASKMLLLRRRGHLSWFFYFSAASSGPSMNSS